MRLRTLSGTIPTPAAGQGVTYQFSPNERTRIRSVLFTLTTDATIASRLPWVRLLDPDDVPVFTSGTQLAVDANSAEDLVLSPQFGSVFNMQGPVNGAIALPWPDYWLPPGWQLQIGAVALDPGDQFSALTYAADYGEDAWSKAGEQAEYEQFLSTLT